MPALSDLAQDHRNERRFQVLVTGFGPFSHYEENPSWLAVKPLHNTVLNVPFPAHQIASANGSTPFKTIHISSLQIPVTYQDVLAITPGLHKRPPILPKSDLPIAPIPEAGYDLILHVGVAGRGALRVEQLGHKLGYYLKDANGQLAPQVDGPSEVWATEALSEAERAEWDRLNVSLGSANNIRETGKRKVQRGFGKGYEELPEEINTEIDSERLVTELVNSGYETRLSEDAGHYLCDFIYYCSLAQAIRSSARVLFLHCPPTGQPLSSGEVSEAIRRIVVSVCRELLDGKGKKD